MTQSPPIPPRQQRGPVRRAIDALAAGPVGASVFISCDEAGAVPPPVLASRVNSLLYKAGQRAGWATKRIVCEDGVDGVRVWKLGEGGERRRRAPPRPAQGARPPVDALVQHLARRLCVPTQAARLAAALLNGPVSTDGSGMDPWGSVGNLRTAATRLRHGLYYTSGKAVDHAVERVAHYRLTDEARAILQALSEEIPTP